MMKHLPELCLTTLALLCVAGAQDATRPTPRPGVQVQMPVASHAVEMRAADQNNASVVTVMADGKLFLGTRPVAIRDLTTLEANTVYVKADARADYQNIISVLDALHGRSVVLLTAAPAENGKIVPAYGVELTLDGR